MSEGLGFSPSTINMPSHPVRRGPSIQPPHLHPIPIQETKHPAGDPEGALVSARLERRGSDASAACELEPMRAATVGGKRLISIVKFVQGLFARDLARCHVRV